MATAAPGRLSVLEMQPYPMHAEETSFVQPNEARHIQTSVSGIRQKTRRTFPARDEHLSGAADTGARRALTANGGPHAGAERIFTINRHGGGPPPPAMKIGLKTLPTADSFPHKTTAGDERNSFITR